MKLSKKITWALLISWGTLIATPSFSQNTKDTITTTSLEILDVITHKNIDSTYVLHLPDLDIDRVSYHCGPEKFRELVTQYVLDGTNAVRREYEIQDLSLDSILMETAYTYAQEMSKNKHYSHVSLQGKRPIDRAMDLWYPALGVGENIWQNFESINEALLDWKESEPHLKHIIDPKFTDIGIACVDGYRVVMFGAKKPHHKK